MKYLLLGLILLSTLAYANTEKSSSFLSGDVEIRRMHSVTHTNIGAQNMYMFMVSGLEDDCKSLYLYPEDDPFLFASVLAGLSASKTEEISVYYHVDSNLRGPWGDSFSCQLTSFSVEN